MDGIIIIHKSKNCTSHDIVQKVKRICQQKVGHTGTLDPMATGVLPLLIGKGTLCSKYLINHNKTYDVTLTLGTRTDTADGEGNIIEEKSIPEKTFETENIEKVLTSFLGKQQQIPPMYSAIKINGKKLYEYARKGQIVEVQPRPIEIYEIKLLQIQETKKQIVFRVSCSKGTYMRSLCEDIAKKLNTVGYMSALNRIQVGDFNITDAISIEELEENRKKEEWIQQHFLTIEQFFQKKPSLQLNDRKLELFLHGVQLTQPQEEGIYRIYHNHTFIGIGVIRNQLLKRDIVL